MAARLKVFVTSDGLTDYVVAASSKAKAMAAWGVRQDLFKEGAARETDDVDLVKAALAQPGEVLRRPAGSRAALAKLKPVKAAKPVGPTKPQLKKVADLERRLAAADVAYRQALDKVAKERAVLDQKAAALEAAHLKARERLEAALRAARPEPE